MRWFLLFKRLRKLLDRSPQISSLAGQMKAYQQEAVLFQKLRNNVPMREAGEQADLIQNELEKFAHCSGLPSKDARCQ